MVREKGGLGRGLEALIPPARDAGGVRAIPIDEIRPNPHQPRFELDQTSLAELADSIRAHGVIEPVIVTRAEEGGYTLIAGERRWRAARLAGLGAVPALVKEATPRQMLELALVENLQRADLNPLEEAAAYRQLIEEHGLTQEAAAGRVGRSRAAVANALRLLHLPPEARDALARGAISEGHARAILTCADPGAQQTVLYRILDEGLSVRQAEELARRLAKGIGPVRRPASRSADLEAVERRLRQALGTKVQLLRSRKGGRIVIHFHSDEELASLYQVLSGEPL